MSDRIQQQFQGLRPIPVPLGDWQKQFRAAQERAQTPVAPLASPIPPQALAAFIDHTLLKPDATAEEIDALCDQALTHAFYSVCVNTQWLPRVRDRLSAGSKTPGIGPLPIAVVGFPLGACATEAKVHETRWAIQNGAREIDMVISLGELKSQNFDAVFQDIAQVVAAATPAQGDAIPVKVILETALLSSEQKVQACVLADYAGARFVKTCTGFAGGGASVEDVSLMRNCIRPSVQIKASGGIRTYRDAIVLIQAGASRLGTSSGVSLIQGSTQAPGSY